MTPRASAFQFAVRLLAATYVLLWLATVSDEQIERLERFAVRGEA